MLAPWKGRSGMLSFTCKGQSRLRGLQTLVEYDRRNCYVLQAVCGTFGRRRLANKRNFKNQMATSLVTGLQFPILAFGLSSGGDSFLEATRNSSRDLELASFRWLGPRKAKCGDYRRSGQGIVLRQRKAETVPVLAAIGRDAPDEEDGEEESPSQDDASSELFRQQMEQMLVNDAKDAGFEGKDLAQLIRNKYGRSYDVQLIKKEFLGRQLLAMNVMWKYREQRSFPLTEEEYLLHLDYIAQNLRGWGAVSFVRESLEKTKERPRIGKAVSIFINPDESGERAREWIKR